MADGNQRGLRYLSLFSGMEAAHLAWAPLGWETVAVAEIDPRACELLAHRLPHVPNLGSVTEITDEQIAALGAIDVVIGGSPCQDLSVAGKRAGLAGARSGLFHEQLRIFHAARHLCGARWLVWENVPGAFSSNRGRDFAVVVGAMAGLDLDVPQDGWGNEGLAAGPNGLVEWSVLDAQWFGVAQRRRRVFAVLDTGNWADRSPILLERESLRGDSPPRREAWEGTARGIEIGPSGGGFAEVNPTLDARAKDGPIRNQLAGAALTWPADVAGTLNAAFGSKQGLEDQHALGGGNCSSLPSVSMCLNAGAMGRQDAESETLIPTFGGGFDDGHIFACAGCGKQIDERWGWGEWCDYCGHEHAPQVSHTLKGEGFDASEDGTGRDTPLVPVHVDPVAPTLTSGPSSTASHGKKSGTDREALVALGVDVYNGAITGEVAATMGTRGSSENATGPQVLAFTTEQTPKFNNDCALTLTKQSPTGGGQPQCVAFAHQGGGIQTTLGYDPEAGTAPTLASCQTPAVHTAMAVRRLTPRECERLQGAPDDWTLVPNAKGKPMADGPRYKMLGNSFAVPVIRWIGRQIERAHHWAQLERAA